MYLPKISDATGWRVLTEPGIRSAALSPYFLTTALTSPRPRLAFAGSTELTRHISPGMEKKVLVRLIGSRRYASQPLRNSGNCRLTPYFNRGGSTGQTSALFC